MMIRTLLIFLILLLSVCLGIFLQHDPGYVLVAIHHWTLETTLWVALFGLILLFFALHTLLLTMYWIAHLPTAWKNRLTKKRALTAQEKTRQGLIEFSEGHWLKAKNHLIAALPNTDTPLFNYLTAARAAQEMGNNSLRDEYLRQAQQSTPDAKIAVELTQAQLQLANKQWEQALATLRHLHDLTPRHPYVLKLLMHLYEEIKDWPQLMALLPAIQRNQILSDNDYVQLQHHVYLQETIRLIRQNQPETLDQFIEHLPKNLRYDPPIMAEYCRELLNRGCDEKANSLLRRCLQKRADDSLIHLYGQLKQNPTSLPFAESLLKKNPRSAALFLCLGHLCQTENLWGKAKHYFEQSIELNPTPNGYAALGHLLEQLHDQSGACAAYRQGLALIPLGLEDTVHRIEYELR